jgi:hypothetical protein
MILFSDSDNKYKLLDYLISHSFLLIRSLKNKTRDYNIDLIFKPVEFIHIPTSFQGIIVSVEENEQKRIFHIKSANKEGSYYIEAYNFSVYHNDREILESPISSHLDLDFGTKVLEFPDKIST